MYILDYFMLYIMSSMHIVFYLENAQTPTIHLYSPRHLLG